MIIQEIMPTFGALDLIKKIRIVTEIELLAKMIFFEARGEGEKGMIGVACVARNRVKSNSKEFQERPTYLSVLARENAFEGLKRFSLIRPYKMILSEKGIDAYAQGYVIATKIYFDLIPDNTKGSLFFWAPDFNVKTGKPNRFPYHCPKHTLKVIIGGHYFHELS